MPANWFMSAACWAGFIFCMSPISCACCCCSPCCPGGGPLGIPPAPGRERGGERGERGGERGDHAAAEGGREIEGGDSEGGDGGEERYGEGGVLPPERRSAPPGFPPQPMQNVSMQEQWPGLSKAQPTGYPTPGVMQSQPAVSQHLPDWNATLLAQQQQLEQLTGGASELMGGAQPAAQAYPLLSGTYTYADMHGSPPPLPNACRRTGS